MIHPVQNGVDYAFQFHKIHQQTDGIQSFALDRHLASIIMPVYIFALAAIVAQRMAGGECFLYGHFKH